MLRITSCVGDEVILRRVVQFFFVVVFFSAVVLAYLTMCDTCVFLDVDKSKIWRII